MPGKLDPPIPFALRCSLTIATVPPISSARPIHQTELTRQKTRVLPTERFGHPQPKKARLVRVPAYLSKQRLPLLLRQSALLPVCTGPFAAVVEVLPS